MRFQKKAVTKGDTRGIYEQLKRGHTFRNCPTKKETEKDKDAEKLAKNPVSLKCPEQIHLSTNYMVEGTDEGNWDHIWYVSKNLDRYLCSNKFLFGKLKEKFGIKKLQGMGKFLFTHGIGEINMRYGNEILCIPGVHYAPEVTLNVLSESQLEAQGVELNYNNNRCRLSYMFKHPEACKFDEDKMKEKQNQYLEKYFDSIDPKGDYVLEKTTWDKAVKKDHTDTDFIRMEDKIYPVKVRNFNDFISFLDLIKDDEVMCLDWDLFRAKFDDMVKWFYVKYLHKPVLGLIPPVINGIEIYLLDLYKLIDCLEGYLNVLFSRKFGKIAEMLGLPSEYGEEKKATVMAEEGCDQAYVEDQQDRVGLERKARTKKESCGNTLRKLEHFGIKLEDSDDEGNKQQPSAKGTENVKLQKYYEDFITWYQSNYDIRIGSNRRRRSGGQHKHLKYLQIVASIEQYYDLSTMTMEETIGRLKTYEERIKYKKCKQVDNQEKLMFTRHERHIAPNCPQKTKANEQSNLVEEDLEPTLLMAILEDSNEGNQVKEVEERKAEASRHAIYILNNIPTKALEDITPYKAIKRRKPNLENLRVFGCIAYAKVPSQRLTKIDDRSSRMVYLGNEQGSKAYRLFNPTTQKICVSRDVKFKKNKIWDWKEYMSEHIKDKPEWTDFKIENLDVTREHHDQGNQPIDEDNDFPNNDNDFPNNDNDGYETPTMSSPFITNTSHTSYKVYHKTLDDLYENIEELLLAEDDPKNYKEASNDQRWIEAMKVELDSINRNNTWKLTTLPKGHKAIGLKWVFKTKKDANGNTIKHKARFVAKGYIQEHGIDFEEVFTLVARMETVRLLLAIAANNKWEVHHLDVKSAFLHGDLKRSAPKEGNKIHGFSDTSYRVNTQEGKGTTGIIFYYGESPISWSTQKQATVALSSCESEFIAATASATQALWLKRLLSKLTHSQEEKVTIQVDNKSAIALMKNPVFHGRSKHIDTKYHFIRECVEREDIQVEFVSGEY
ncbi:ribonuclease H-like domain, reverse transcriptase, RNA-dependent DNA polymerase [Tanacetum coccineum]